MFCKNCGNIVGETDKFCQKCGTPIAQNTDEHVVQATGQPGGKVNQQTVQKPLGMKWYKFVVNVQLFLSMFVCLYNAITYFTGTVDGTKEQWEVIYTVYPKLKILNIIFGVIQLLYIGFLAVIRYRLVKFKKNAPTLYIINFLIQIILEFAWFTILATYTGMNSDDSSSIAAGMIVKNFWVVIYLLLNMVYFKKRKFMFNQ